MHILLGLSSAYEIRTKVIRRVRHGDTAAYVLRERARLLAAERETIIRLRTATVWKTIMVNRSGHNNDISELMGTFTNYHV